MDHGSVFKRCGCRDQESSRLLRGRDARNYGPRGTGRGISAQTCRRRRGSSGTSVTSVCLAVPLARRPVKTTLSQDSSHLGAIARPACSPSPMKKPGR